MQSVQSASRRGYQRPDKGAISIVIGIMEDAGEDFHLFQANENRVPYPLQSREDIGVFQDDETTNGMSIVGGEDVIDVDVISIHVNDEGALLQPAPPRQNQQITQANSLAFMAAFDVGAEVDDFDEGAEVDEGGEAVRLTKIRP